MTFTPLPTINISVQHEDFDIAQVYAQILQKDDGECGAVVIFVGRVRDLQISTHEVSVINTMTLEHYPGMTEKALQSIAEEACARWSLLSINIIHRVGELAPKDNIVLLGVSSSHRSDAFSACEMMMDYLKTQAPFWKKTSQSSGDRWVDAKEIDIVRAQRWQK